MLPCPECNGDEQNVVPYRLGWGMNQFTERITCRVCMGRGVVYPATARRYALGTLDLPWLYERWKKWIDRERAKRRQK